jgi:Ice-binding-like
MSTITTSQRSLFRYGIGRLRPPGFVRSALSATALSLVGIVAVGTVAASAAPCPSLGVAAPFAILGAAGVTTTGGSSVVGEVGAAVPLTTTTSLVPTLVGGLLGTVDDLLGANEVVGDTAAQSAEAAASSAYQSAAADVPTHVFSGGVLVNVTLSPGVYAWPHSLSVDGLVTLNALGNRNGDFVFQVPGNLGTSVRAAVRLENGAQANNVLWQVGGDATLAPSTSLVGTLLADHDITLGQGTSLLGRAQSLTGLVNLDASTVTLPRVLTGVGAAVGAVTSRASTTVPVSGSATTVPTTLPASSSTTCTCAATSVVPRVLPLIPLSAIAVPDLALPSAQISEATGLVPRLLATIPLNEPSLPVATTPDSGSGISAPTVTSPATPSVSLPLGGLTLPALVAPTASSIPGVSGLAPNLSLPSLVSPSASSIPSVSGLAPNLELPSLVSPSTTSSPGVPVPSLSLPALVSPPTSSTPGATHLIPNLALPSLTTPSLTNLSLPLVSTPSVSTSPRPASLIRGRARPSTPSAHAKVSTHAKSTTTTVPSGTSIPVGAPATGEGGPGGSASSSRVLVALGALILAAGSAALGLRRRYVHR